jgi:BlaI family transcriptional regulator, penicillinase repressor
VGKANRPSELETQVLSVLWERGALSVRDILSSMPDGKARAYTTILSVMQVMEKKGFVTHKTVGKSHIYRHKATRRQVLGPMLRGMVKNVFGGSPAMIVQQLIQAKSVNAADLAEIRQMLDEAGAAKGQPKGTDQ